MVRVTSQGSNRRSQQRSGSGRVATSQAETGTGMQVTRFRGPWKNTHQGTDCTSGHPLNTPAISPR
ncbi:unnamed protein product [Staurois parvus]|uniref:Uncharacterized protein n=1 Tax=Staurois parvus TaxID=386267 RepID=A0ABN9CH41_9NEOB|nr:unnamed protein product [Staurois parvus]